MKDDSLLNLKVGIFICIALLIFGVFVFVLGAQKTLFQKTYHVETTFPNIAGLLEGAVVRLSGVGIGSVRAIRFPDELDKSAVKVIMSVNEEGMRRIGPDSKATIKTEGLLGDKYIEIIKGKLTFSANLTGPMVIDSLVYPEFDALLGQSEELIENVIGISEGLREIIAAFKKGDNVENIGKAIASLSKTAEQIEKGNGMLHTLIYGRTDAKGKPMKTNALEQFEDAISKFNDLLNAITEEEGIIHGLVYDKEMKENLERSIANVESSLSRIGGDEGILEELRLTISTLRAISEKIDGGEGTLGALINDPELYDTLKSLLGEADRSKFIRATVRYLVEQEKERKREK